MLLSVRTNTLIYLYAFLAPVLAMYAWRVLDFSSELFTVLYVGVILSAYFILTSWRLRIEFLRSTRTGQTLALFLALHMLTTLLAAWYADGFASLEMVRQLFVALIPAILAEGFYDRTQRRALSMRTTTPLETVTFWLFIICTASIMMEYSGLLRMEQYGNRYFGALGDAVAWFVSFCAIVTLIRGRLGLFVGCVTLLLLTQSRGAIAILCAAFLLQLIFGKRKSTALIAISVALCAVVIFLPHLSIFIESFLQRLSAGANLENDRIITIGLGIFLFEQNPILGGGFNMQPRYYNSLNPDDSFIGFGTQVSTAVQIFVDGGLVTGFAFLSCMFFVSKDSMRAVRRTVHNSESIIVSGAASWVIAFLWLNHTASWLVPGSILSPLVFSLTGILACHSSIKNANNPVVTHESSRGGSDLK